MADETDLSPVRVTGQQRRELALQKLGRAFLALARQQLSRKAAGSSGGKAAREVSTENVSPEDGADSEAAHD